MVRKLADEFLDILQKRGGALRKKEESFKWLWPIEYFQLQGN